MYHSTITVRTAMVMILLAWLTPSCISFLPIFLEWYTTEEYLTYKVNIGWSCRAALQYPSYLSFL